MHDPTGIGQHIFPFAESRLGANKETIFAIADSTLNESSLYFDVLLSS